MKRIKQKQRKKRNNEPFSAISHTVGVGLSIAALVLMVVFSAKRGGGGALITGVSIFGATLILLYVMSSLFHFWPKDHRKKSKLQQLDQAAVFVLIAGTYTPLCLAMASRGWGWSLFGLVWGIALPAAILKILGLLKNRRLSTMIYISLGWIVVIALVPILDWLSTRALFWLFGGGLVYTIGAVFYALEARLKTWKWITAHDVFHLFVVGGSIMHFFLMLNIANL